MVYPTADKQCERKSFYHFYSVLANPYHFKLRLRIINSIEKVNRHFYLRMFKGKIWTSQIIKINLFYAGNCSDWHITPSSLISIYWIYSFLLYKPKDSTALPKMDGIWVLSVSCQTVPLMGLLDDILLMTIHQSYIKDKWKRAENILTKTTF